MIDLASERAKLVLGRWTSLSCWGAIAGLVVAVLEDAVVRLLQLISDGVSRLPPSAIIPALTAIAIACSWPFGSGRWRAFLGFKHFWSYPPLWIGLAVSLPVWVVMRSTSVAGQGGLSDVWWIIRSTTGVFWLLIGLLAIWVLVKISRSKKPRATGQPPGVSTGPTQEAPSMPSSLTDFASLRRWLLNDQEISQRCDDKFGHWDIATRIRSRLEHPVEAPTMALIGRVGSGKSSVRELVMRQLDGHPTVRLVSLSLWPYETPEAAVRGILHTLVRTLGEEVNVLPLRGLSDDYAAAIERSVGTLGSVARVVRGSTDPQTIIQRISDTAIAINIRLVLWVEDLERFSGSGHLSDPRGLERETERLGPIRALVHLLDRTPAISVVLADTSLRVRFDASKIVRFVEQIPRMATEDAWQAVQSLRTACLGGCLKEIIDPASPATRRAMEFKDERFFGSAWLDEFRPSPRGLPDSVVEVVRTPRSLKSALRATLEVWETLAGEIDLDAVLVMSVIRAECPDVFALVAKHIEAFPHGLSDPLARKDAGVQPHPVVHMIDAALREEDIRFAASVKALLQFLFPHFPPGLDSHDRAHRERPQGLCVSGHANYWQRYLKQEPIAETERDQLALQSIRDWCEQSTSDLIERVINPRRSGQIESFVGQFAPRDLCRLLVEVTERLSTESSTGWEHRSQAPGLTTVWRMMLQVRPRHQEVFETIKNIVMRLAPTHLPLAHDVVYWFAAREPNATLVKPEEGVQARTVLVDSLRSSFVGAGAADRLRVALRDGSPYVPLWISWSIERVRDNDRAGLPFEGWELFANTLLALAETHPDIGVPAIVPFVTTSGHVRLPEPDEESGRRTSFIRGDFNEEQARRLFQYERLVDILARFVVPVTLESEIRVQCEAAVSAAQKMRSARERDHLGSE